jgi:hypothetical protein
MARPLRIDDADAIYHTVAKEAAEKGAVAWWLRQRTTVSARWISEWLRIRTGSNGLSGG